MTLSDNYVNFLHQIVESIKSLTLKKQITLAFVLIFIIILIFVVLKKDKTIDLSYLKKEGKKDENNEVEELLNYEEFESSDEYW